MRGRRLRLRHLQRFRGLIPAGAGQTSVSRPSSSASRAHPRGCGADNGGGSGSLWRHGSSPRVRGRPRHCAAASARVGLIPAGAGQTARIPRPSASPWAHPRGCGADDFVKKLIKYFFGSSPRVRGRLHPPSRRTACPGLIPAGAGQTTSAGLLVTSERAHPRGCGADVWPCSAFPLLQGLIPAGAGQTSTRRRLIPPVRAHPRGCGADGGGFDNPPVRPGLIPAGAGQTRWCCGRMTRRGAHPRGCGADQAAHPFPTVCGGSSPRVRGRQTD